MVLHFLLFFFICKQNLWFQKRKHSQLSVKCSRVQIEIAMTMDRPYLKLLSVTINVGHLTFHLIK
jgi:hypothetical protein